MKHYCQFCHGDVDYHGAVQRADQKIATCDWCIKHEAWKWGYWRRLMWTILLRCDRCGGEIRNTGYKYGECKCCGMKG